MLVTIEGNYFSIMYIFEYDAKVAFPKTLQIASVCPIAKTLFRRPSSTHLGNMDPG
jgi:hypothetical protein